MRILKVLAVCAIFALVLSYVLPKSPQVQNVRPAPTADQLAAATQEKEAADKREKERADAKALDEKKQATLWAAKQAVTKILNDPESAKFGKIAYRDPGFVCGYVNAKNGFGGYTGEKGFISLGTPETTWLEGQSKDFKSVWNKQCASK